MPLPGGRKRQQHVSSTARPHLCAPPPRQREDSRAGRREEDGVGKTGLRRLGNCSPSRCPVRLLPGCFCNPQRYVRNRPTHLSPSRWSSKGRASLHSAVPQPTPSPGPRSHLTLCGEARRVFCGPRLRLSYPSISQLGGSSGFIWSGNICPGRKAKGTVVLKQPLLGGRSTTLVAHSSVSQGGCLLRPRVIKEGENHTFGLPHALSSGKRFLKNKTQRPPKPQ